MKRRDFLTLVGGAAASSPLAARAQQPAMPVIGFLGAGLPEATAPLVRALNQGLNETGFVDGRNILIEYRSAKGQYERLPDLAADLVRRQVAVIVASPFPAVRAAKAATASVPIVFLTGGDPVELGLVASLNRPGGNLTGVGIFSAALAAKRMELLHELIPKANTFGLLVNRTDKIISDTTTKDAQEGANAFGLKLEVVSASTDTDFEAAFATLVQRGVGALVVGADGYFSSKRDQLVALAARYAVPTIYEFREFASAGGLISYGTSITDMFRQMGVYAGRILKGEKPADLPVQQSVKVELVINLKTAKALGVTFPLTLLGRADEVIE